MCHDKLAGMYYCLAVTIWMLIILLLVRKLNPVGLFTFVRVCGTVVCSVVTRRVWSPFWGSPTSSGVRHRFRGSCYLVTQVTKKNQPVQHADGMAALISLCVLASHNLSLKRNGAGSCNLCVASDELVSSLDRVRFVSPPFSCVISFHNLGIMIDFKTNIF